MDEPGTRAAQRNRSAALTNGGKSVQLGKTPELAGRTPSTGPSRVGNVHFPEKGPKRRASGKNRHCFALHPPVRRAGAVGRPRPVESTSSASTPITTTASSFPWPSTAPSGSPCGRATTAACWSTRSTTTSRGSSPWTTWSGRSRAGSSISRGRRGRCREAGCGLVGWEGVLAGDVPLGAGLSSSAALEMAVARAMAAAANLPWNPAAMAKLCQRVESKWVGVNCGIMDQMISAGGRGRLRHAPGLSRPCLSAGAAAVRRGRCRPGHLDPAGTGRFSLQRAPPAVRTGGRVFRRRRPSAT